ncbi:MAG: hypothetical protein LBK97_01820 [Prevotellaceae bacterium]|jgi:hypothetical protein|nr:hypothetical protein [Prevotellaceae bacterium]
MKRTIVLVAIIAIASVGNVWSQTASGKNTGAPKTLLRMIKADVPDSVVFTLTQGKEVAVKQGISVYLVSGEQSYAGETGASGSMSMHNNELYLNDQTILIANNFKIPDGFKAKKIRFDIADTVLYYDIATQAWTD